MSSVQLTVFIANFGFLLKEWYVIIASLNAKGFPPVADF